MSNRNCWGWVNMDRHNRVDKRKLPAYSIPEAAHYLGIPRQTLRSWVCGGDNMLPAIDLDDKGSYPVALSFMNLVEAYALVSLTKVRKVRLQQVRKALEYVKEKFQSERPLIEHQFQTDGVYLFIEKYGRLINATEQGQLAMKSILLEFLTRIERDGRGLPVKLYPITYTGHTGKTPIVIDPNVSFGRPVLKGTGIPTSILADRFKAGDSFAELAEDYGRKQEEIEEAIRCELAA